MPEMETRSVGHNIRQYQHHLQCNEAGDFNFTHSFMISKVQTLNPKPF